MRGKSGLWRHSWWGGYIMKTLRPMTHFQMFALSDVPPCRSTAKGRTTTKALYLMRKIVPCERGLRVGLIKEPLSLCWFVLSRSLYTGTPRWAVPFSPPQRATTILWVEAGRCGLASISLSVQPCGTWCSTSMVRPQRIQKALAVVLSIEPRFQNHRHSGYFTFNI